MHMMPSPHCLQPHWFLLAHSARGRDSRSNIIQNRLNTRIVVGCRQTRYLFCSPFCIHTHVGAANTMCTRTRTVP